MNMRRTATLLVLAILALTVDPVTSGPEEEIVLWPEQQRAFLQDGPGLLLSEGQHHELVGLDEDERARWITDFLAADPMPETSANELTEAIGRRIGLVRSHYLSPREDRARVMFLNGEPTARLDVECGQTFVPLEIWTYGADDDAQQLVFYKPGPDQPYRLWLPLDSKRVLYISEMEYYLEQYEELKRRIVGKRFDLQTCPDTKKVDNATGVEGLFGYRKNRVTRAELAVFLEPPSDLAAWSRRAAAEPPVDVEPLPLGDDFEILFPREVRQRIVTRFVVAIPDGSSLGISTEPDPADATLPAQPPDPEGADASDVTDPTAANPGAGTAEVAAIGEAKPEWILGIDGLIEQDDRIFDEFRLRYKLEPRGPGEPVALALERPLRPGRKFVVRLRIEDQVGGGVSYVSRGFEVPAEPQPIDEPAVSDEAILALGEELALQNVGGRDSLVLVPPDDDIQLGLWRAEALVTGDSITRVVFLLDGEKQLTRGQRPFSAELRLSQYPTEQVVRVEGYDAAGNLVAVDEVVLNQPRGALRVRITEPLQGVQVTGEIDVKAEVVVPDDRRVEEVIVQLNNDTVTTLERPPWIGRITVPPAGEVSYLTVIAVLDDGSRAEDVRFVNAPQYLEEVDVNLVELFTTVNDRSGRLIRGLDRDAFSVLEDGRPQQLSKFEIVDDLPLTLGITIDTSGSMVTSLPEAKRAAIDFLENVMTPRDRAFAVSFAGRPELLIPATDDVGAIETALDDLRSYGYTSLHDAVVTSLYYFRGVRGRRALIVLSDGDDTISSLPYRDALEYARRSGVVVYAVGLNVGGLKAGIRKKLTQLAEESGGKVFFIKEAQELFGVYDEIEEDLRSQYLLAYASDASASSADFRTVEVKVKGGLKARTIRGYYP